MKKNVFEKINTFLKKKRVPKYLQRLGPKKYTTRFLLTGLILKQHFKLTYRKLAQLLKLFKRKAPHFTTFQKALRRFQESWLVKFFMSRLSAEIIAIDATGFSPRHASRSYEIRIGRSAKDFVKLSIALDVKRRKIVSAAVGKRRHDNTFFAAHLNEVPPFSVLVADKAYDSNANFRAVRKLGGVAMIPLRKNRKGLTARRAAKDFDEKIYHQRSNVEAVFSSIKRKFGSELLSVSFESQKKEVLLKCLAYNILLLCREILQSRLFFSSLCPLLSCNL